MQNGQAAEMQHRKTARICSKDEQHRHAALTWASGTDMQQRQAALTCTLDMQQ
jgi:hypothetical protein